MCSGPYGRQQAKRDEHGHALYSKAEIAKHNTPDDCWVVVHGSVYDVTSFVPRHPGGAMIYVKAGGECSLLFDSYHPATTRHVLDKFLIGHVDNRVVSYERQGAEDELYVELKAKVHAYFKQNQIDPRFSTGMYVKAALILITLCVSAYVTFYGSRSFVLSLIFSTVLGVAMAEVGICIQHDANHGAFSRNNLICTAAGLTLDAVGASSFMWKQQHVVGHHTFTNVDSEDPDIRVSPDGSDVRRVTPWQPRSSHHTLQHVYLGLAYSLLALKSIFVDDFRALAEGCIGAVRLAQLTAGERAAFWGGKALFAAWFLALPAARGHWGAAALLTLWAWSLMCCGWTLAFMFQVAHVVEDVQFLEKDADGVVPGGWAADQIQTSADFSHGSWFWTHFSGGLNYQIVHHLFPGVIHTHYPALAPLIMETAKKYGVKYQVYPSLMDALRAHFRHLKKMGVAVVVPSLHSIG